MCAVVGNAAVNFHNVVNSVTVAFERNPILHLACNNFFLRGWTFQFYTLVYFRGAWIYYITRTIIFKKVYMYRVRNKQHCIFVQVWKWSTTLAVMMRPIVDDVSYFTQRRELLGRIPIGGAHGGKGEETSRFVLSPLSFFWSLLCISLLEYPCLTQNATSGKSQSGNWICSRIRRRSSPSPQCVPSPPSLFLYIFPVLPLFFSFTSAYYSISLSIIFIRVLSFVSSEKNRLCVFVEKKNAGAPSKENARYGDGNCCVPGCDGDAGRIHFQSRGQLFKSIRYPLAYIANEIYRAGIIGETRYMYIICRRLRIPKRKWEKQRWNIKNKKCPTHRVPKTMTFRFGILFLNPKKKKKLDINLNLIFKIYISIWIFFRSPSRSRSRPIENRWAMSISLASTCFSYAPRLCRAPRFDLWADGRFRHIV